MSYLRLSPVDDGKRALRETSDGGEIAALLAERGVLFERWRAAVALPADADQPAVLAAYAAEVDKLKARGYGTVDVVRMKPSPDAGWADKARAARGKFLDEHTHAEDEIRFFVEGSGIFYLRLGGEVAQVRCEAGDLLSVPAGTRHWFDMGTAPMFCAIRFFQNPDGWVGKFTGDPIARGFPTFDELAAR